jgi:hypothetical protein
MGKILRQAADNAGRNANGDDLIWHIALDHSTGTHNTPGAYLALWHHSGANPNQGASPEADVAAQVGTGSDMCMIANPIMMVDATACIQDDVLAKHSARIDHNPSTNHAARLNQNVVGHSGMWMTRCSKVLTRRL